MSELKDKYVTSLEGANMLGLHPNAIQSLIWAGKIPAEKMAGRWMISRSFIMEMAKTYVPRRGRPRKKSLSEQEERL